MASSALSNLSLSLSPCPNSARSHSKSLNSPKILAFPVQRNPRPSSFSFQLSPRPSSAAPRVAETDPKTISGDEKKVDEKKVEQENVARMKMFVQAYKQAILEGDEKAVSEIEAAILVMENEKNSLSLKCGEIGIEISSEKDMFLRLKADFENCRKRVEKDRLSLTSDVQGKVIESLLPLVDSFEKMKQHLKPETEKEKKIDTSYQGIYRQFVETMRSLKVAMVGTVGKPFDPSIHEAVAREESQRFKEGIVTEEVRRGFVLSGRLLRPAAVKVSIGPGPRKVPSATRELSQQAEAAVEDAAATSSSS